jgi:hypothetical protein
MAVKALRDAQQQLPDDDAVAWALVEYLGNDGECSLVPKQGLAQACRGAKRFAARDAAAGSGVFDTFCVEYACQVGRCAPLHLALERSCQGKR